MVSDTVRKKLVRHLVPRALRCEGLPLAIQDLKAARPVEPDGESPIFVQSAGWRCGSTLLQRLISGNKSTLMWGEPYGDLIPVCRLASTVASIRPSDRYLLNAIEHFSGPLAEQWIANLNPGAAPLWAAHRAYFDTLFAEPATQRGFSCWGVKWVRLSAHYSFYLRWLYPQARFVFLVRHPLEAYRSYVAYVRQLTSPQSIGFVMRYPTKAFRERRQSYWYSVRPRSLMDNVFKFMAHWAYIADSFLTHHKHFGALLIRYEDLVSDEATVSRLSEHLGGQLQRTPFAIKLGSSNEKPPPSLLARWVCRSFAGDTCRALGYDISHTAASRPSLEERHDTRCGRDSG